MPAVLRGLLRDLVLAARDLAGPAWLAATGDDPDIAAFTALVGLDRTLRLARTLAEALQALPATPGPGGPARPGGTARPGPSGGDDDDDD